MAKVSYDEDADVLYVELSEGEIARTSALGDLRLVDEDQDGTVLGVEFISASHGVDLDNVPRAPEIQHAIHESRLAIPLVA